MATDQEIPTDQVKGIKRGSEGYLKVLYDGEWKYPEDIPKQGKTSPRIQKGKSGQVEREVNWWNSIKPCTKTLLKEAKKRYDKGKTYMVLKEMYKHSWYGKEGDYKYVRDTRTHSGRYYSSGQEKIARRLGIPRRTVGRCLKRLEEKGYIHYRYKGYKGRGNSLIELAYLEIHRRILQGDNKKQAKHPF